MTETSYTVCDSCGHLQWRPEDGYACLRCGSETGWAFERFEPALRMQRQILDRDCTEPGTGSVQSVPVPNQATEGPVY